MSPVKYLLLGTYAYVELAVLKVLLTPVDSRAQRFNLIYELLKIDLWPFDTDGVEYEPVPIELQDTTLITENINNHEVKHMAGST